MQQEVRPLCANRSSRHINIYQNQGATRGTGATGMTGATIVTGATRRLGLGAREGRWLIYNLLKQLVGGERGQNREVLPPLAAHYIY